MKKTIFCLFALITFTSCLQNGPTPPLMVFENGLLEVNITDEHSKETLMDLKKQLLDTHNITIDFDELVYNGKGKIDQIRIKVKNPNGESGSASSWRALGMIAPHVWFKVDFNEGSKMPFGIGAGKR